MLKVIKAAWPPIGEMLLGYVAGSEPLMDFSHHALLVADYAQAAKLGQVARPPSTRSTPSGARRCLYWQPGRGRHLQPEAHQSIEDLKGLKIRTFNAVSTTWVKAAGGNPVSMPWGEVYMAMSAGSIDAPHHQHHLRRRGQVLGGHEALHPPELHHGLQRGDGQQRLLAALSEPARQAMLKTAAEIERPSTSAAPPRTRTPAKSSPPGASPSTRCRPSSSRPAGSSPSRSGRIGSRRLAPRAPPSSKRCSNAYNYPPQTGGRPRGGRPC